MILRFIVQYQVLKESALVIYGNGILHTNYKQTGLEAVVLR